MNQNRWTCLTTVLLTTVIAPIATVHAKNPTAPALSGDSYRPLSPQSLPTITPLTVTELETEAAIPVATKPVPQVSKLPTVIPLLGHTRAQAVRKSQKIAQVAARPTKKMPLQASTVNRQATAPSFNPNSQVTAPIFAIPNPIDSSTPQVNPVAPLPQVMAGSSKSKALTSFTSKTASAPIVVVRSDKSPPTVIQPSATVQAETVRLLQPQDSGFDFPAPAQSTIATAASSDRSELKTLPQVAPIVSQANDSADLPSFESGSPVFVFDSERPQQIVATAIAQVDDKIVAPEPSIAIPVERPKQATIPTQLPTAPAPATSIVKIEAPAATTQPALDKIVATQTGQASWYGIEGGPMTANGERYNPNGLTAAHRTLPFGTKVRITSIKTGKFVTVRINDRGPFRSRRIIDVSAGAAQAIGIKNDGIGEIRMEVLGSEG
jgi:rare lipoprotein A